MSAVLRFLTVMLVGLVVVALIPAQPAKAPPTKEQIAQWIKQLGADDFEKREEASKLLWEAGQPAEAALEIAAKSKDEEIRVRSKALLEKFRYGIYPDTPKKVADLITTYQTADPTTRANIIGELFEAGTPGCRALMKLANAEDNAEAKKVVMGVIAGKVALAVPSLLEEGNYDTLEMFLDLSVSGDGTNCLSNYCAYFLLRDKLKDATDHLPKKTEFNARQQQEVLVYLQRAKGDLKAARAAAEKVVQLAAAEEKDAPAGEKKAQAVAVKEAALEMVDDLLFETGDWKELAKQFQANTNLETIVYHAGLERVIRDWTVHSSEVSNGFHLKGVAKDMETLGFGAAFHRLAGNKAEFGKTIAAILKYVDCMDAKEQKSGALYAGRALLLNGKPNEALKVLKKGGELKPAFEILCMQLKYGEAFEILEQIRKNESEETPSIEILAARQWYLLGERDKAKAMFAKLAATIKQAPEMNKPAGADSAWLGELVSTEARLGLREDAFEHTTQILESSKDVGWPARLFPGLFPGRGDVALVWFEYLRAAEPAVTPGEQLKKIRTLLEGKTPDVDLVKLLTDAETAARAKGDDLDRWIHALASTAFFYKKETVALALLEKTKTSGAQLRLGDLAAEKKQWAKAAEHYKAAWELDKHKPLSMYLYGEALTKAGKEAEGKKLMDRTHWFMLGDEEVREAYALALAERDLTEASRRENEILLLTSKPGSTLHNGEAQRRQGLEARAKKEFLKAAGAHEKALLTCLRTSVYFPNNGAYLGVPVEVHRLRARGLLEAGKLDEARKEIAEAQTMLPGDVDLAILIVPELEKRGQAKEAKEIFDNELAVYEKLCAEYTKFAWAHNSAAWLSVCCGRNLEAAKAHALKATELMPTNAAYFDTLAEIYFQMGDKDKAITTQKKALELDPQKAYFQKQLRRIEAGNPKADLPIGGD